MKDWKQILFMLSKHLYKEIINCSIAIFFTFTFISAKILQFLFKKRYFVISLIITFAITAMLAPPLNEGITFQQTGSYSHERDQVKYEALIPETVRKYFGFTLPKILFRKYDIYIANKSERTGCITYVQISAKDNSYTEEMCKNQLIPYYYNKGVYTYRVITKHTEIIRNFDIKEKVEFSVLESWESSPSCKVRIEDNYSAVHEKLGISDWPSSVRFDVWGFYKFKKSARWRYYPAPNLIYWVADNDVINRQQSKEFVYRPDRLLEMYAKPNLFSWWLSVLIIWLVVNALIVAPLRSICE